MQETSGKTPSDVNTGDYNMSYSKHRMKLLVLGSLLSVGFNLSTVLPAQSVGTVEGKVLLDRTGEPLHNVTVHIVPLHRNAVTDDNGFFRVAHLPPGRYTLLAHMHALADESKIVDVVSGSVVSLEFRLNLANVRENITVTASGKMETSLATFLTSVSLDSTDLASQTATSLGDVLENQAGVAKRSFGPGTSRPVIRGFDGDRVLIMQDGVSTGTLSSQSGDHGEPIDPNSVERVEVVRGPSTLLYEGSAIGGVVNIVTGHDQAHKEPHRGLRGHLTALEGTNNFRRGINGGFEYGLKSWMAFGNVGTVYQNAYSTPLGLVPNSQSNIRNGSFGVSSFREKSYFSASYGIQDGVYGIPVDNGDPDRGGPVTLPFLRQNAALTLGLKNLPHAMEAFQLTLSYSDWHHTEWEGVLPKNHFYNKQFVYRGVFDQRPWRALSGNFGFWGMARDYKAIGEEAITPPTQRNAFALFGVESVNIPRGKIQFGARMEHTAYDPLGLASTSFTGVAASGGINLGLWKGGALVASYNSSFRSPALEELYAHGPHAGNITFEIGDARLRRERGHGVDLSVRHSMGRLRAEANFFHYAISDFIFLAPTGRFDAGLPVANYSQGASRYRGVEGRLSAGIRRNAWLHVSVDSVNAQLKNPERPLPRIPPVRGRIGVDYRFGALSLMPELVVSGRQDRVYIHESATAGYATLGFKALYSITSQHVLHLFGLQLFNGTDQLYRNHLSFIKTFAPEMGRAVMFTYTIRLI